MISLSRFQP